MLQHCLRRFAALALFGLLLLIPTQAFAAPVSQDAPPDIVETAVSAGNFTTLVAALQAAGLDATLQGEGPFTVFAPTDEAFAALPAGTVDSLLADPQGALTDVLLYHVVAGTVTAADAVNAIGGSLEMVNGQSTTLSVEGNRLLLNNAGFVVMNIQTANGIIHVIDQVLIPSTPVEPAAPTEETATEETATEEAATEEATAEGSTAEATAEMTGTTTSTATVDIVDTAIAAGNFETLVAAVQAAGLVETLKSEGPLTVFAPTDEAFAQLPEGVLDTLLSDPTGALTNILLYHVVPGRVPASDVVAADGQTIVTVGGPAIRVTIVDDVVMVDDAQVVMTDIETANGIIHVIDTVLIPSSDETEDASPAAAGEGEAAGDATTEESTDATTEEGTTDTTAEDTAETADNGAADADGACASTYVVKRGDTLSQIAASNGVNIQALLRSNHIRNANYIYVGQEICIPN